MLVVRTFHYNNTDILKAIAVLLWCLAQKLWAYVMRGGGVTQKNFDLRGPAPRVVWCTCKRFPSPSFVTCKICLLCVDIRCGPQNRERLRRLGLGAWFVSWKHHPPTPELTYRVRLLLTKQLDKFSRGKNSSKLFKAFFNKTKNALVSFSSARLVVS